jgi:hypothetical protein
VRYCSRRSINRNKALSRVEYRGACGISASERALPPISCRSDMTPTLPGPLSDLSTAQPTTTADAGNDASFAATVVEELFIDTEEGDSLPAVDTGDEALQLLPTLSHVGRYLLKHQLGSGGLGAVYAALDPLRWR